jgi:hypothetical protein
MMNDGQKPALVPAVFPTRDAAEIAIAALRRYGVDGADIGVLVPEPGRYYHRDTSDAEVVTAVGQSAAIGAPIGSIGGMTLLALTASETLAIGVGGLFLAGVGGFFWGGIIGGLLGVITRVRRRPEEDRWCEVPVDGDEVLVVVRVEDWSREPQIAELLMHVGARCVVDHLDLDRTWEELEFEHPSQSTCPLSAGRAAA